MPGGCWPSHAQALDDAAVLQVLLDDLVDISTVDVRIPDRLRINDDARAFLAAIEATGLVDADLARPGEAELFHAALGVVAQFACALVVAAHAPAVALVAAEKDVSCVMGHTRF